MGEVEPRSLPEVSDDISTRAIPHCIYHPSLGENRHEYDVARIRHCTLLAPWRISSQGLASIAPGNTDTPSPLGATRHCVGISLRRPTSVFALPPLSLGSTPLHHYQASTALVAGTGGTKATKLCICDTAVCMDSSGNVEESYGNNRRW